MIEIQHLTKRYKVNGQAHAAVKDVSFSIKKGEILGLVGESGSGKSTLGKMLVGLIPPSDGRILFEGKPLETRLPTRMQMIFQDPSASLNPKMTVENLILEPLKIHKRTDPSIDMLLDLVRLPKSAKRKFPHEFSGGQKQRIVIARALALKPDFLVCDEPVSSLDASIRTQIANLLLELQREFGLTLLFIAHDLAIVEYLCTRVAVMHQGEIIESGETNSLYANPIHPFTQALLQSVLSIQLKKSLPVSLSRNHPGNAIGIVSENWDY